MAGLILDAGRSRTKSSGIRPLLVGLYCWSKSGGVPRDSRGHRSVAAVSRRISVAVVQREDSGNGGGARRFCAVVCRHSRNGIKRGNMRLRERERNRRKRDILATDRWAPIVFLYFFANWTATSDAT